jgi:hypothetical protein
VKSLKLSNPWYSCQTSQRPSNAPSAWSSVGSGKALILVIFRAVALILATPEKLGE